MNWRSRPRSLQPDLGQPTSLLQARFLICLKGRGDNLHPADPPEVSRDATVVLSQGQPQERGSAPLLMRGGASPAVAEPSAQPGKGHSVVTSCSTPWRH